MRYRRCHLTLLFLLILLQTHSLVFGATGDEPNAPDAWSAVAPGIEYQKYSRTSPRRIKIFVARMDRGNHSVAIDSSIAQGVAAGDRPAEEALARAGVAAGPHHRLRRRLGRGERSAL